MEKKLNILIILVALTLGVSILSYVVLLASSGYISLFKSEAYFPSKKLTKPPVRNIYNPLQNIDEQGR